MRHATPWADRPGLDWIEQRGDQWKYPELWDNNSKRKPHANPVLYGDDIAGLGMLFQARLARIEGAGDVVLLLSMATSYNGFDKSPSSEGVDPALRTRADIKAASTKSFADLRAAHVADYRKLFDRVELRLGVAGEQSKLPTDQRIAKFSNDQDPELATLYFQYGRYLMIAGSRPGTQPLNLQGIWSHEVIPPWAAGYTTNINAEMNYWPAEPTNLSECHEPLFRLIRELAVSGRHVAQKMYGRRGWVAHHNTTLWRCAQPVDLAAEPAFWPMSSGWLCQHLWEHYQFTGDRKFLETEAYPLMK